MLAWLVLFGPTSSSNDADDGAQSLINDSFRRVFQDELAAVFVMVALREDGDMVPHQNDQSWYPDSLGVVITPTKDADDINKS